MSLGAESKRTVKRQANFLPARELSCVLVRLGVTWAATGRSGHYGYLELLSCS